MEFGLWEVSVVILVISGLTFAFGIIMANLAGFDETWREDWEKFYRRVFVWLVLLTIWMIAYQAVK